MCDDHRWNNTQHFISWLSFRPHCVCNSGSLIRNSSISYYSTEGHRTLQSKSSTGSDISSGYEGTETGRQVKQVEHWLQEVGFALFARREKGSFDASSSGVRRIAILRTLAKSFVMPTARAIHIWILCRSDCTENVYF